PELATRTTSWPSAYATAACRTGSQEAGEVPPIPKGRLMTCAPCEAAYRIPAAAVRTDAGPEPPTITGRIRDGGLDSAFHLADGDTGSLGQRPHRPPHLPGGEPPLGRARRQRERRPHTRLGLGRPGGQGQPARREQAGHRRRGHQPAARGHGTSTLSTSPAVCVYQAVHLGYGARHGPAHGSGHG